MALTKKSKSLSSIRRDRLMTQAELARIVEMSPGTISHLEHGRREGRVESWIKLAEALDTTIDQLIKDADAMTEIVEGSRDK